MYMISADLTSIQNPELGADALCFVMLSSRKDSSSRLFAFARAFLGCNCVARLDAVERASLPAAFFVFTEEAHPLCPKYKFKT